MSTLLLRLAGPIQSWGIDSKFETRRTEREPSKSGVIGLLAAALGRRRNEPVEDLSNLYFGVRVDKEGELIGDFHTARTNSGKTYVSNRYYLSDAAFLVGVQGEDDFIEMLADALRSPAFPLFLGRRSCTPTLPIVIGIRKTELLLALRNEPWILQPWQQEKEKKKGHVMLRIITDTMPCDKGTSIRKDVPITFNPENRMYSSRTVKEQESVLICGLTAETAHDAMSEL